MLESALLGMGEISVLFSEFLAESQLQPPRRHQLPSLNYPAAIPAILALFSTPSGTKWPPTWSMFTVSTDLTWPDLSLIFTNSRWYSCNLRYEEQLLLCQRSVLEWSLFQTGTFLRIVFCLYLLDKIEPSWSWYIDVVTPHKLHIGNCSNEFITIFLLLNTWGYCHIVIYLYIRST